MFSSNSEEFHPFTSGCMLFKVTDYKLNDYLTDIFEIIQSKKNNH